MAGSGRRATDTIATATRAGRAGTGRPRAPAEWPAVDRTARGIALIALIGGVAALVLGFVATAMGWYLWRL